LRVTVPAMSREPGRTNGIAVVFSRPSDLHGEADWDAWYDEEHLPDTVDASGAWVATRWEVADRPAGASPPVGFTHMAIYEFDDVRVGGAALLDHLERLGGSRSEGSLHPLHTISGVDTLVSASGWPGRLEPRRSVTGQVFAYVGPNDGALDTEWNEWLAAVHIPDMLASGGFTDASRWVRLEPARFGPNYMTIYDVEDIDVMEAVALSGRAMAPAHEAGRILPCHSGGVRAALRPTGRYGAEGYRSP
jgi:hypothetical protein